MIHNEARLSLALFGFIHRHLQILSPLKDAAQDFWQGRSQEWQSCQGSHQGRQKEEEKEDRVLCHLHLQGCVSLEGISFDIVSFRC